MSSFAVKADNVAVAAGSSFKSPSAPLGKAGRLADGQDRQPLHELNNFVGVRLFRCADEENFAIPQVLQVFQVFPPFVAPDDKSPLPDFFVLHETIEDVPERIGSQ